MTTLPLRTLQDVLNHAASTSNCVTLIEGEQKETYISYAGLKRRALGLLGYMQQQGVKAKEEMILLLPAGAPFLDAFWASVSGAVVPVPLAVGISDEHKAKVFKVWNKLDSPWLFTDVANYNRLEAYANSHGLEDDWKAIKKRLLLIERIESFDTAGSPAVASPDDLAFVQFSSGSTGAPKGVQVTHGNLIANIEGMRKGCNLGDGDVLLNWMPLTHDMGLIGLHMMPMHAGIPNYIIPTEVFIRRPLLWLIKASEHKATFLGSPNFGYKHFLNAYTAEKLGDIDLSAVRVIFNGAEPIAPSICDQFLDTLAPYQLKPEAMYPVYGLAEATLAVTMPPLDTRYNVYTFDREQLGEGEQVRELAATDEKALSFVGVGSAIDQMDLRIGDAAGKALPAGSIGRIYIAGASVTSGYINDPEKTAEIMRQERWLDTGDLGVIYNNELVITGRAKDIIFLNGQNYYPHDLERIAEELPGIELGKVAAAGLRDAEAGADKVLVFVVYKGKPEGFVDTYRQVKTLIAEQTGLEVHDVVPVRQLPKTTSGKVQRYKLAAGYEQGEFAEAQEAIKQVLEGSGTSEGSSATELEIRILNIANTYFRDVQVGPEDNLFEMGTSSLILAQIHEKVDELWPDKIDITDYFDYPTIRDLAGYLESKL